MVSPTYNPQFRAELDRRKQQSVLQLLFRTARLTNELSLARAQGALKLPNLRAAHLSVFPHIDLEGTRSTELARRMDISKQAVGQLLDELEGFGVIQRAKDPADGRARLVQFTERGALGMLTGLKLLEGVEDQMTTHLGKKSMQDLHRTLLKLDQLLSSGALRGE
ncbi:MAG: hypothetical protein RJA70_1945 [Pseudomonadota bacterium]|jgi:DNA-binding MarR family transcriptional regulator